jgi:peptidoglycan hydrolase-like protein with peptidoglycan-binding domain
VPAPVSTPELPKALWPNEPPMQMPAPPPTSTQASNQPLTREEIVELQNKLKVAGFDPGPVDGVLGPRTGAAAQKYADARKLSDAEPSKNLLVRLRGEPAQSAELSRR